MKTKRNRRKIKKSAKNRGGLNFALIEEQRRKKLESISRFNVTTAFKSILLQCLLVMKPDLFDSDNGRGGKCFTKSYPELSKLAQVIGVPDFADKLSLQLNDSNFTNILTEINMNLRNMNLSLIRLFTRGDKDETTHVAICEDENNIYLVWQGTNSLKEWQEDFDLMPTLLKFGDNLVSNDTCNAKVTRNECVETLNHNGNNCKWNYKFIPLPYFSYCHNNELEYVHRGFLTKYNDIRESVIKTLTAISNDDSINKKNLVITGHSLGAALTTLNVLDLQLNYRGLLDKFKDFTVYSFATPNVGNSAFASLFEKTNTHDVWRICYKHDLVEMGLYFYEHVGTLVLIGDKDKNKQINNNPSELLNSLMNHCMYDYAIGIYEGTFDIIEYSYRSNQLN